MRWQVKDGNLQAYGFEYDFLDRLREAHFAEQVGSIQSADNVFGTSYVYDLRGNITRLKRSGKYGSTVAVIDDLTYSYDTFNGNTNQLKDIRDDAPCPDNLVISHDPQRGETYRASQAIRFLPGFTFSAIESGELVAKIGCAAPTYTKGYVDWSTNPASSNRYDANGNLTYDVDKNFSFEYNHLNLPYRATYNTDFETNTIVNQIEWLYNASGRKWRKQLKRLSIPFETKDYLGALEYKDGSIEAIYHAEGRAIPEAGTWKYNYLIRDHLGNTRVVFENDGTGEARIVKSSVYYPFGMEIEELSSSSLSDKYPYLFVTI